MDRNTRIAVARFALRLANERAERAHTEAWAANMVAGRCALEAVNARQALADAELSR
jgi:hypothetical protein